MRLILASNNKNKLREFRQLVEGMDIELLSQSEAGLHLDVEETGTTLRRTPISRPRPSPTRSAARRSRTIRDLWSTR